MDKELIEKARAFLQTSKTLTSLLGTDAEDKLVTLMAAFAEEQLKENGAGILREIMSEQLLEQVENARQYWGGRPSNEEVVAFVERVISERDVMWNNAEWLCDKCGAREPESHALCHDIVCNASHEAELTALREPVGVGKGTVKQRLQREIRELKAENAKLRDLVGSAKLSWPC